MVISNIRFQRTRTWDKSAREPLCFHFGLWQLRVHFLFYPNIPTRFVLTRVTFRRPTNAKFPILPLTLGFVFFLLFSFISHQNNNLFLSSLFFSCVFEMKAPNMETITESLEKSMQNFSLNDRRRRVVGDGFGRSSSNEHTPISDRTLELNSHLSLPSHWEQCLDLKVNNKWEIHLYIISSFIFLSI